MNESLSRIVADLFAQSQGGEELSSKVQRLRNEIKKIIESEGTIFGKFRELVESFREIIPDEKQRYNASIKALSTTLKLSKQEIIKAVNDQLDELKILEKGLMPALPDWRSELRAMEASLQELRGEITKLRERTTWLESEEKRLQSGMATREKDMAVVEKAMRELFTDIGSEITFIKKKVEEFTTEKVVAQPVPLSKPVKSAVPDEKKADIEQESEIEESFVPQDSEFQKKCPMCGGRMDFQMSGEMWQCYSCGYEELKKDEVLNKNEETGFTMPGSDPNFDPFPDIAGPAAREYRPPTNSQPVVKKKNCPACHKKMQWYEMEKTWRCSFCEYERRI